MGKKESRIISNALYFEEVAYQLRAGKEVCIRVKGNSMLPFIKSGDRVLLVSYRSDRLFLGANILAKYDGNFVFHRYVGQKNGNIVLAGDGNLVLQEYILDSDIIAIGLLHYPDESDATLNIDNRWKRMRGMIWYHLRIVRRLFASLKRIF
ncbi:hypothetical protein GEO21_05805 [Sphingobacterium faecium]|uniref:S24/S26 family peptidase n=1 Tax=Sphingobacterium faecium TaxID=34087 RepID=UPI001291A28E|nr:S24/S26 family peptidase [Sphingobacterium faecium]MQP27032.1 hypothetical protein [Sphingobacterium faecium]